MAKLLGLFSSVSIFLVFAVLATNGRFVNHAEIESVNGGSNCAACSFIVGLTEQLSEIHNESITKALERLCNYLPDKYRDLCKTAADFLGPFLVVVLVDDASPDTACHAMGFCKTDPGHKTCHIFPKPKGGFEQSVARKTERLTYHHHHHHLHEPKICDIPGIKEICKIFEDTLGNHDPLEDVDGDRYSVMVTGRGSSWRGKDCDDTVKSVHPGAKSFDEDVGGDSNCNGIFGVDSSTQEPWEAKFCNGSKQQGVVVLGDSISAHFHLPEQWFTASELSEEVFRHLPFAIENELDWPELSAVTGYKNTTWPIITPGPTDSIYLRMWKRNRCNFRDYENIAVNGARSSSMNEHILPSLFRDKEKDHPILAFYALVGNDVCNGHPDTFAHMTTPAEMRANVLKTLTTLDEKIPKGSHVLLSGLADGRVLYNSLFNRTHPIGKYRNDVTYAQFYDFLNCLEISPCTGWMNSNQTIRDMTTQRAKELSAAISEVSRTYSSKNFDTHYFDCPLDEVFKYWESMGGKPWQLIEPVDGFHSNQIGQALTAKIVWENLEKTLPGVLGPVNPNNDAIFKQFGDQGGYM